MTNEPPMQRGVDDIVHAARLYADTRNYQRAKELLGQALSENPDDPVMLAHYARAEFNLGHQHAAARSAHSALSQDPSNELAMRIYSLALDRLGRPQEALWMAWHNVRTHPQEWRAHYVFADLLHRAGQLHYALVAVTEALRLDPADADSHALRGLILKDLGRVGESTAAYQEALRLEPSHAMAINNLAVNRLRRGRLSQALSGFIGAAAINPALGDFARMNVAIVIARVTRLTTLIVAAEVILALLAAGLHAEAIPTWPARVLAGVGAAVLTVLLCWLLRAMPRRVLVSALRRSPVLGVRIASVALAAVIGVITAVGWPWELIAWGGFALLFASVVSRVIVGLIPLVVGLILLVRRPKGRRR